MLTSSSVPNFLRVLNKSVSHYQHSTHKFCISRTFCLSWTICRHSFYRRLKVLLTSKLKFCPSLSSSVEVKVLYNCASKTCKSHWVGKQSWGQGGTGREGAVVLLQKREGRDCNCGLALLCAWLWSVDSHKGRHFIRKWRKEEQKHKPRSLRFLSSFKTPVSHRVHFFRFDPAIFPLQSLKCFPYV